MAAPEDEEIFLRDLVKTSRQKIHFIKWIDRDGTPRQTALTVAEAAKLNGIAHREKISQGEVLRRAAHIPVAK